MRTHVIILAQGLQKRLPTLTVAKQMLPLPACGDTPILHRTVLQLWHALETSPLRVRFDSPASRITIVAWFHLMEQLIHDGVKLGRVDVGLPGSLGVTYHPDAQTLIDPGNSSLKGIEHYLRGPAGAELRAREKFDRTVVLFGDVVYSWACLRAIIEGTHWHMGFVGTSDLSTSGGELWGLSWERTAEHIMLQCLDAAITKHPPFAEYQCGQMRRWLWEIDKVIDGGPPPIPRTWYRPIDDYTRDIDLPEHVRQLDTLSAAAAADDLVNGVTW